MAKAVKIDVIEGDKTIKGTRIVTGYLKINDLVDKQKVDIHDPTKGNLGDKKAGYQRLPEQSRIKSLFSFLSNKKVDLITGLVCSLRDFSSEQLKLESGKLVLSISLEAGKNMLYIIDGQHRTRALYEVLKDPDFVDVWKDRKILCVFVLGPSYEEEKELFYYINNYAKSINTGTKMELKIDIEDVSSVEKESVELVRMLKDDSKLWKDIIKYPNSSIGMLPNSAGITSLKHLYTQDWFKTLPLSKKYELLEAFWGGLKIVLPKCFVSPEEYTLQRAVGVSVLHRILSPVYNKMIHNGEQVFDPKSWSVYLAPLKTLGEENRLEVPKYVQAEEFWTSGSEGAAGRYSSGAGKKNLINLLLGLLVAAE